MGRWLALKRQALAVRAVIISVHVPKTAGISFHTLIRQQLGERLRYDYGDWPEEQTADAIIHRQRRRVEAVANAPDLERNHDVIHGHFSATKYQGIFALEQTLIFLRDPYQRAVSMYEHALRETDSPHPRFRVFKEKKMTLLDLIAEVPNQQSLYMADRPFTDFAMIGITERFSESLNLFEAVTGITLERGSERWNVNPAANSSGYVIEDQVRRQVDRYQADDLHLYTKARDYFQTLLDQHLANGTLPNDAA